MEYSINCKFVRPNKGLGQIHYPPHADKYKLDTYRQISDEGNPDPDQAKGFIIQGKNNKWYVFDIYAHHGSKELIIEQRSKSFETKVKAEKYLRRYLDYTRL